MDGTAVKEIAALEDAQKTIEVGGQTYAREEFKPVFFDPRPSAVEGNTLTGLVDYLKSNIEGVKIEDCLLVVKDYAHVELVEKFGGASKKRTVFFAATLDKNLPVFPFDNFVAVEDFIIKARSLFQPTEDLDAVVALVSRVTEQNQITAKDDGISQEVQVKKGVSGAVSEGVSTKGIYSLKPYRTFRELSQPESSFILRLKAQTGDLPRAALFDAEGGTWRNIAMAGIKGYLENQLSIYGIAIPVIA
jgi:hypothetical protein